jgi:Domain of unknown function (DUF4331)
MSSIRATATHKRAVGIVLALAAAGLLAALLSRASAPSSASAASHREAPLISLDPEADITDFFMFRSYEAGQSDKVDLIMDVIPGEEPSSGPNYFNFDPSVVYRFNVDNNNDGKADDVQFEFSFRTELRGDTTALGLPLAYTAIPPITHLDGAGSEGLGVRQKYTLTMVKGKRRTVLADGLIAVPSNVGPRTMPNYDALAAEGTYSLGNGIRVFAGQRDDPFYIDLGAVFDTLNLRLPGTDMLSGFNVHTIALEVPSTLLNGDTGASAIGAYASTSRRKISVQGNDKGKWVQVQRLANPLINEVIIGLQDKDRWNATEPEDEAQFLPYYLKPRLALAMQLFFGLNTGCTAFGDPSCSPNPPAAAADLALSNFNRTDLENVLLKYQPSDTQLSELLRLNLNVAPTPLGLQQRLTILAGDNAGWPNGRRPNDDVTDVAVQVVGGPNYIGAGAGDGVNTNDKALPASFPFLASPWDGRGRFHVNP